MSTPQEKLDWLIADSWFAFEGDIKIKRLEDPVIPEPARQGEGGLDCKECARPDSDYIWTDDSWRLSALSPTQIPGMVMLKTRVHCDSFSDMPTDLLNGLGPMIKRIEDACMSIGDVARVHVNRWGDGGEHFHLWFMPRPLGAMQLRGSMLAVWADVLPDLSEDEAQPARDKIAQYLEEHS